MSFSRGVCLILAVGALAPVSARAQDAGRAGIVTGAPAGIGIIWDLSKQAAIRADFTFSTSSTQPSETTRTLLGVATTSASRSYAVGVSALFYLRSDGDLRLYATPRVSFSRSRTNTESSTSSSSLRSTTTSHPFSASGAFGAQYSLHRHFGVYGEAGVGFGRSKGTTNLLSIETEGVESRSWGTRSAVGVIVYF